VNISPGSNQATSSFTKRDGSSPLRILDCGNLTCCKHFYPFPLARSYSSHTISTNPPTAYADAHTHTHTHTHTYPRIHAHTVGCGSSHLTFGLWHYTHNILGIDAQIVGCDSNAGLMARSNQYW
jgi:hypothetical protein